MAPEGGMTGPNELAAISTVAASSAEYPLFFHRRNRNHTHSGCIAGSCSRQRAHRRTRRKRYVARASGKAPDGRHDNIDQIPYDASLLKYHRKADECRYRIEQIGVRSRRHVSENMRQTAGYNRESGERPPGITSYMGRLNTVNPIITINIKIPK